jgi:manganese/iron transport system permease protein
MYLSYFYNLPSGPAIVLVVSSFFTLALLFSPSQGILTNRSLKTDSSPLLRELRGLIGLKH